MKKSEKSKAIAKESKIAAEELTIEADAAEKNANRTEQEYFVYVLECADGTLYCGYTDDVERRAAVHNSGKGAKYTRSRLPVKVVYYEKCASKTDAMKREYALKHLTRAEKLALISGR